MASSIQGTGICQNIPYCEIYLPSDEPEDVPGEEEEQPEETEERAGRPRHRR